MEKLRELQVGVARGCGPVCALAKGLVYSCDTDALFASQKGLTHPCLAGPVHRPPAVQRRARMHLRFRLPPRARRPGGQDTSASDELACAYGSDCRVEPDDPAAKARLITLEFACRPLCARQPATAPATPSARRCVCVPCGFTGSGRTRGREGSRPSDCSMIVWESFLCRRATRRVLARLTSFILKCLDVAGFPERKRPVSNLSLCPHPPPFATPGCIIQSDSFFTKQSGGGPCWNEADAYIRTHTCCAPGPQMRPSSVLLRTCNTCAA
jgi:hypothetical protein